MQILYFQSTPQARLKMGEANLGTPTMWAKLAWVSIGVEKEKNGRFRLYDSLFSVNPAGANKMGEANLGTPPRSRKAFQKTAKPILVPHPAAKHFKKSEVTLDTPPPQPQSISKKRRKALQKNIRKKGHQKT